MQSKGFLRRERESSTCTQLEYHNKTLAETARRKAEVEAELYVLKLQKEAVAASTEAEVYEAAVGKEDELSVDLEQDSCIVNTAERTKEYVRAHSQISYMRAHSQISYMPNRAPNSQLASQDSSYVTQSYAAGSLSSLPPEIMEESKADILWFP